MMARATHPPIVVHVVLPGPHNGPFDFASRFPTAVEQVRVHDKIVVGLQCRPEVVLADAGRDAALQAAGAMAVPAAPRPAPQFAL